MIAWHRLDSRQPHSKRRLSKGRVELFSPMGYTVTIYTGLRFHVESDRRIDRRKGLG